uniref:Putative methyltransferase n=1 Tax=viral metagenome TaxID=1070528 RepID=A0A6H1ZGM6_9ZZZZ
MTRKDNIGNCVTSGQSKESLLSDGARIRRLTPLECERLMSWTDDWTKYGTNEKGEKVEMSDSSRYKMCGNGVVSNVVRELVNIFI